MSLVTESGKCSKPDSRITYEQSQTFIVRGCRYISSNQLKGATMSDSAETETQYPQDPAAFISEFREAGLKLPTVPPAFKKSLAEWGPWHLATQPQPEPMDDYMMYSLDSLRTPTPDQFAINHSGHGINSYSLNLRMSLGPLAILVQQSWGGVYGDNVIDTEDWNELMRNVSKLLREFKLAAQPGWHQRQFLISASNFRMDGVLLEAFEKGEWIKLIQTDNWVELIDELRTYKHEEV